MQVLSEKTCIEWIKSGKTFHASIDGGAFNLKIDEYSFYVATAIHNGHQMRSDMLQLCLLDEAERLYEEDPFTGEFISSLPITLTVEDSRYEYDLNREPQNAVYETAWGKQIWKNKLDKESIKHSQEKHQAFYRILNALVKKLQSIFGCCLLFDIHSYNYQRIEKVCPVFNIGTDQINLRRWRRLIGEWSNNLNQITLPNLEVQSKTNDVFYGRGYLATYIAKHFEDCVVLPTEIKKIYMDELSGTPYHLVIDELKEGFKQAIISTVSYFHRTRINKVRRKSARFLSTGLDPAILKLDRLLFQVAQGIDTLNYINPKNIVSEKKRFFSKNFNISPNFTYKQMDINPYEFREKLYRLPMDSVQDVTIQQLYRDVIDSYAMKIDLITSVGQEKFLYNSLRYYGEPTEEDVKTAEFLLYAKEFEEENQNIFTAEKIRSTFVEALESYDFECKIKITDKIIASALVDNSRKTVYINKSAKVNEVELHALIHHEIGVHMATTMNALSQKLKVFRLGLPGNTCTQEGLAVLSEYCSGNLPLKRLKVLALRVIAVHHMINGYDFSRTFKSLVDDYGQTLEDAFRITARVYRGGGFTKDFLYLRGLRMVLDSTQNADISALFVGKTSLEYLIIIQEMIERDLVQAPKFLPWFMSNQLDTSNQVLDYLVKTIYPKSKV